MSKTYIRNFFLFCLAGKKLSRKRLQKNCETQKRRQYLAVDRVKVLFVAFLHGFRWSSSEFDLEIGRPARNGEPGQLLCRKNGKVLNWMRCKSKAIVSAMVYGKEMFWLEIFGFSSCHTIFGASFRGYQFFLLSKMGKNYLSHDFRVWSNIFRQWDFTAAPVAWAWRGNPS